MLCAEQLICRISEDFTNDKHMKYICKQPDPYFAWKYLVHNFLRDPIDIYQLKPPESLGRNLYHGTNEVVVKIKEEDAFTINILNRMVITSHEGVKSQDTTPMEKRT